jgi:hypothetical protein
MQDIISSSDTCDLYSGGYKLEPRPGYRLLWLRFCDFPQSLEANTKAISEIKLLALPSTLWPNYSLIILHFIVWIIDNILNKP